MIEQILALDKGFEPQVKPLDPAIGNFDFVQTINFKDNAVPNQVSPADEETADNAPEPERPAPRRHRVQAAEPDIRPDADEHKTIPKPQVTPQEKRRSFFDFFRRKPKEGQQQGQPAPQPEEQKKKKRFLFF